MSKVNCKLCNCEGVDVRFSNGTSVRSTLCMEHLQGYQYACSFLPDETVRELVRLVSVQEDAAAKEADDNGKSK